MLALVLGVVITGSICQEPQGRPPVFRAEAYVVPLPVTVSRRTWYGGSKPVINLDAADLEIILENNVYVPIRLDADAKTPGRYLVSFTPPDHLRDGKPRQVQLRIKKRYSIKVTMTLPPPTVPGPTGDDCSSRDEAVKEIHSLDPACYSGADGDGQSTARETSVDVAATQELPRRGASVGRDGQ